MNIEELNKYLQTNVKCSLERFNNPAPFVDDYGYEQIFCNGWNLYYSVAFQNKIRNSI